MPQGSSIVRSLARSGVVHGHDVFDGRASGFEFPDLLAPLPTVDQDFRRAALDDAPEFVHREAPVQVLQHRADFRRRPEEVQVLRPVRGIDGHPVALADAEAAQIIGGAVGPFVPFGERGFRTGGVIDQRDPFGRQLRALVEPVRDVVR
jgi:hypothetical protein